MAKRKNLRKVKLSTLLAVGEGAHDKAFLKHLQYLYDRRDNGQKTTIDSADGGSPLDIINTVIRKHRHTAFDKRYILIDSDVPICNQARTKAAKNNIDLIESRPLCLEGLLLDILNEPIPTTSQACKAALHPKLSGKPTTRSAYSDLFPKQLLDKCTHPQIVQLRNLISNTLAK